VRGIDARATAGQELVEVLVATEPISAGEAIAAIQEEGKVELAKINRSALVDGWLDSARSLKGSVALDPIFPGEQILSQNFGEPGTAETLTVPEGMVAISVSLNDPQRVAGFVTPGARVTVFASFEPEVAPYNTSLLLEDVQVIGVGTTSTVVQKTTTAEDGEQTTEEVPKTILTIAVDQEQAERTVFASNFGQLSFALRNEESKVSDNPGVTIPDVVPELDIPAGED
jgi:pilus assembly protein CpaB